MSAAKASKPAPKAKAAPKAAAPAPIDLARWIGSQRWYARTDDAPVVARTDRIELPTTPAVAVVVATLRGGARYQLVQRGDGPDGATTAEVAAALARFATSSSTATGSDAATVRAHAVGSPRLGSASARPLGAEQSNTSAMVGGTHVLKVLRRLVPGVHPEVEVGLHLAGATDVPVPRLAGWYELVEGDGTATVLGVVHELVPGALDGWALVLSSLAGDPGGILARLHDLGRAIARTHRALGRAGDGFGTAPLEPTVLWALADRLLADPLLPPDGHHLVARAVEALGTDAGAAIRVHGDLHLGQTLLGGDGWMLLDFEGEPDRPVAERRVHASPLRDVAGMLRSLAYAVAAHERSGGAPLSVGWEPAARAALLDGYLAEVDPDLLPRSAASVEHLLVLLELEKVLYEVAYERAHRPDWEAIPLAGLDRLVAHGRRPTRGTS